MTKRLIQFNGASQVLLCRRQVAQRPVNYGHVVSKSFDRIVINFAVWDNLLLHPGVKTFTISFL